MNYRLEKLNNNQLAIITERFVTPDKNTFNIKVVGAGFNADVAKKIIDFIKANCKNFNENSKIVILNDFSLHMTKALMEELNIPAKNIKLVFCSFKAVRATKKDPTTFTAKDLLLFKLHPVVRQNKELEIITWKEFLEMSTKIDGIIANPPYGAIGANITKKIIDNVEFVEYANLMPMVDYEKCRKYNLWHNVELDNIGHCPGGFEDAGISPIICKINKAKVNSLDADSFRIVCLENKLTQKYFKVNIARKDTFNIAEQFQDTDLAKTIALPLRTKSGNHSGQANLGKTEASQFFLINNNIKSTVSAAETKSICCTTIVFKSASEKQNVTNFLYSNIGYKFASWLMTGMNRDSFHLREHHFWFPKVDWTRAWTVEEILADYGYDADEIQAVMDDLQNFKGMED